MIEQTAMVVALDGNDVWVESTRQSVCAGCTINKGCGAKIASQIFKTAPLRLRLQGSRGLEIGDQVRLGVDEGILVRASLAAYLVPLLFMIVFSMAGEFFASKLLGQHTELPTALSGMAGLAAGLFWLTRHSRKFCHDNRYQPVILGKI